MLMGQAICLGTGEGLRPSSPTDLLCYLFSCLGPDLFIYCFHVQKMVWPPKGSGDSSVFQGAPSGPVDEGS